MNTCLGSITPVLLAVAALCSSVFAQQWTPPEPGWLYVLASAGSSGNGGLFVVDPIAGNIMDALTTEYHPDFGLCGNGSKLYLLGGPELSGVLSVIETRTGNVLTKIPVPHRAVYTVRPSTPGIACSSDGQWLFVQQMITVNPGMDEDALRVIDAQNKTLSPHTIPLPPGCGIARLIQWPFGTWDIAAQCSAVNSLRLIRVDRMGDVESIKDVSLNLAEPWTVHRSGFPAKGQRMTTSVVVDQANRVLVIFRGGGGVDQLDPDTLTLRRRIADDWQRWVPPGGVAISKSGMAFVGSVAYNERTVTDGLMNTISAERTSDWTEVASKQTTIPFSSVVLSLDGQTLYAVNPKAHSVTMFNASTLEEIKTINGLGEQPSLILIQP